MRDPAFLFYASDFLMGVSDLSMEERGVYITLLCLQHQKGRLTPKMIQLCGGVATNDVMSKFSKDSDGNFFNERLEIEMDKRKEHADKQRQRALSGWDKRKKNENAVACNVADATALPLVIVNRDEDIIENKDDIKAKKNKKKYGEFQKVKLTDEEFLKAKEKYGELFDKMVEKLDVYLESKKSDPYASHLAVFAKWVHKSVLEDISKQTNLTTNKQSQITL